MPGSISQAEIGKIREANQAVADLLKCALDIGHKPCDLNTLDAAGQKMYILEAAKAVAMVCAMLPCTQRAMKLARPEQSDNEQLESVVVAVGLAFGQNPIAFVKEMGLRHPPRNRHRDLN